MVIKAFNPCPTSFSGGSDPYGPGPKLKPIGKGHGNGFIKLAGAMLAIAGLCAMGFGGYSLFQAFAAPVINGWLFGGISGLFGGFAATATGANLYLSH